MNSFSINVIAPGWFIVLCLIIAFGFSYVSYRVTVPPISEAKRWTLISLRSVALSLLLFFLFEPALRLVRSFEESPSISFLIDNSVSAGMRDASRDRSQDVRSVLSGLSISTLGKDADVYIFDQTTKQIENQVFTVDSLKFDGGLTNISQAFKTLTSDVERRNTRAVVLVSDGQFNDGENPLYSAELLARPVYVIGVGDSTEPKDVALQSLITNEIGFVGSSQPINVNVKAHGWENGERFAVVLKDNGAEIGRQEFQVRDNKSSNMLVFEYNPKNDGNRKITAQIISVDGSTPKGEFSKENNTSTEYVKVLKTKRTIALFAGAPSPDVAFLTDVFRSNPTLTVRQFIQRKGAEFYNNNFTPQTLSETEAIALVGFPTASTPDNVINLLKNEAERGKPIFFIAGANTDYNKLKPLEPFLPFSVSSSKPQEMLVFADVKSSATSNPTMKINGNESDAKIWNDLPPIFKTETFVKAKPESEVLSTIRVGNSPLAEPLILTRTLQNKKSLAILGYGLFRWKLLGYAAELAKGREAFDVGGLFVQNSLRWLTTEEQGKLVRVKTTKKLYTSGETVEFTGQIYDASFNPIENAEVRVKMKDASQQDREIVLSPLGGGRYVSSLQGLMKGDYSFTADVKVQNQAYGSDNGRFSVGESALEYLQPRMNVELLRQIAARTGGQFFTTSQAQNLLSTIRNNRTFTSRPITERKEITLWNFIPLLAAAILCFSIEWFLRKRSGLL